MIRELTRECVHCGFCLPTCPTYVLWSEEMDSPRGRIQLMEARLDGTIALNRTVVEHFDRCLGCMACVSSCPSGVRYDRLIEATRDVVEREFERSSTERLVRALLFQLLPYPKRMGAALRLAAPARRVPLPRALQPLVEIAPPWYSTDRPPGVTPASGEQIARIGILTGLRPVRRLRVRKHWRPPAFLQPTASRSSRHNRAAAARCRCTPDVSRRARRSRVV